MQPKWIVWENVPGVLSSGKGRDFGTFLGALGELGYGFAYRVLDAQWFGVAQRRRRVFVVGHLGDWRRAAAVLFERESVFGNPPTRGKAGERVTGPIAGCSNGGGANGSGRTADDADSLVWRGGDQANSEHCIDHAGTLNCDKGQQGGIVAFHPTQDPISSMDGSTHAMGCGSKGGCCTQAVAFTKSKRAQSNTNDETWVPGEVSPTMSCFDQGDTRATTVMAYDVHGTLATKGASQTDCHTALRSRPPGQSEASTTTVVAVDLQNVQVGGDLAGTLDTTRPSRGGGQAVAFSHSAAANSHGVAYVEEGTPPLRGGGAGNSMPAVAQAMAVRRLTPRECERLQGFPDDYTLVEYRKKPAADGPRYRALGNSMAVPVMRWIGERIAMVDAMP
jgi:DNA (cytosine-5)-methyltransferase 1